MKEKQKKLINANVIIRHNAIVISCDEQMRIPSFSLLKYFPIKLNDVTIKNSPTINSWILIILIILID